MAIVVVALCAAAIDGAGQEPVGALRPVVGEAGFIARAVVRELTAPIRWRGSDWLRLGGGVAGIAALSLVDAGTRDIARRNRSGFADDVAREVKPFGRFGSAAVVGAFFATGLALDDARARAVAIDAFAASVVASGFIAPAAQAAVGRSRPWHGDGAHAFRAFSGRHSFPSGHTTQAFVVAAVIATHYDAGWVDAAAYSVASLVALSRMYHDAHHLSDVTAGALLGTIVGQAVARMGRAERTTGTRPLVGPGGVGLVIPF